jgi:hypothetical protein
MIEKDFLRDEIRSVFNIIEGDKFYILTALSNEYTGYVVSDSNYKGVGIEIDSKYKDFKYSFENIKLFVKEKSTNGRIFHMLELVTDQAFDINKFSNLCIDFLDPGKNGEKRKQIQDNPQTWVDEWNLLIGNKATESNIYPYLGELIILKQLLKDGQDATMTSQGSHDIETSNSNIEVKTTIMRYQSLIQIHSKYQLQRLNNNPLYLYFVRLEESTSGVSINSVLNDLKNLNYNMSNIRSKINDLNSDVRDKCYKIDEIRKYLIDDKFPKITDDTFIDGKIPENISGLVYTVDLDGLPYENVKIDIN